MRMGRGSGRNQRFSVGYFQNNARMCNQGARVDDDKCSGVGGGGCVVEGGWQRRYSLTDVVRVGVPWSSSHTDRSISVIIPTHQLTS